MSRIRFVAVAVVLLLIVTAGSVVAAAPGSPFKLGVLNTVAAAAPRRIAAFHETGELDTAFQPPGLPRFRVNAFRQRGDISFAARAGSRTNRGRRRTPREPERSEGTRAAVERAPRAAARCCRTAAPEGEQYTGVKVKLQTPGASRDLGSGAEETFT